MRKTKKMMALALATSMVLGSSMMAFAAEGDATPGGSGNVSGAGSVEGHVNKEVLNVILPTVPSGSSAFAYTMDPESIKIIQGKLKHNKKRFPIPGAFLQHVFGDLIPLIC